MSGIGRPAARNVASSFPPMSSSQPAREGGQYPLSALADMRRAGDAARERRRHFLEGAAATPAGLGSYMRTSRPITASNFCCLENASTSTASKRTEFVQPADAQH
jgi:hypothetical protein